MTPFVARILVAALGLSIAARPAAAQVAGQIAVYPQTSNIELPVTRQFSASVPISPNTVVWLVNGIPGGNATVGTMSASGLYTTPAAIPAANTVTISAQSTAYPTSIGNASLTLTRPCPWIWSASPSSITIGNYSLTLNGANFAPDSKASANGVAIQTIYVSPTKLVVNGVAAALGTINIAVSQPAPGAVTGSGVAVPVKTSVATVAVAPSSVTMALNGTQPFVATVTGNTNTAVTSSVNGIAGGSAAVGTVSASGL